MSGLLPVVSFVARSGTGKTTFLEKLLPALRERGVRVMVIKHDVHGFEVDKPGKDTWRLRKAGADKVLIANADQMALMGAAHGDTPLRTLVERYAGGVDLVISEGYRKSGMQKILVARSGSRETIDPASFAEGELVAAVSDHPLGDLPGPLLPLNDPGPCADFLVEHFVRPAQQNRELTGVLLAGGWSRRMGKDKAGLDFRGKPLLPELVERLAPECSGGVLVVKRRWQELGPLPAAARVVDDLLPDRAALGGLYTALALADTPFVFLAACDMPLLSPELIHMLRGWPCPGADALLPIRNGKLEPVHAIYGHRCLGAIKEALLSGEYRMTGWFGAVRSEHISQESWQKVDPDGLSFRNVNTPEELAAAELLAGPA